MTDTKNAQQEKSFYAARFSDRLFAFLLDSMCLAPLLILSSYNRLHLRTYWIELAIYGFFFLYKPLMEWRFGATLGKMMLKLRVTNLTGGKINLDQAMRRFVFFAMILFIKAINAYSLFDSEGLAAISTFKELFLYQQTYFNTAGAQVAEFLLMLSTMIIVYDFKHQALHDKIASTQCIHIA